MGDVLGSTQWAELLAAEDAATVVTDGEGTILRWGPNAARIYGHPPEEARGRNIVALLGHDDELEVVAQGTASAVGGARRLARRRARTASGDVVEIVGFVVRIDDEDGEPRLAGVTVLAGDRGGPTDQPDDATWDRLRLVAELRAARLASTERGRVAARLQQVAAQVAAAHRLSEVATAAVDAAMTATGADGGALWVLAPEGGVLRLLAHTGFPDDLIAAMQELPLDQDLPITAAVVTGEPVWVGDRQERDRRFPLLTGLTLQRSAIAAAPLTLDERTIGGLTVGFADPRRFRSEDRVLLTGIAAVSASAVSRGLAIEASEAAAALLATALESAPVGFGFFDRQLRFERVNGRLAEINGLRPEDHVGRSVEEVVPGLAEVAVPLLQAVLDTGEPALGLELVGETAATPGEQRVWREDFYPVVADTGEVLGVGAVVQDVTEARATAARLALLADATTSLTASLDTREVLDRLADLVVERVAEVCSVLLPEAGGLRRVMVRHRDPAAAGAVQALLDLPPVPYDDDHEAARVWASGKPIVVSDARKEAAEQGDGQLARALRVLDLRSGVVVPLATPRGTHGVLAIGSTSRVLGDDDLRLAADLAVRAGAAFENASRYEREHTVAEALQRAVLPERLPWVPGLALAARYEPALETASVGGDWYDAVPLGAGRVALVIGDVGGHGLRAAATMGQLRNAIHAWLVAGLTPEATLAHAEHLLGEDGFATVGIVVVDPADGSLTVVSAGHLPPVVVHEGGAELLAGTNPPIGAGVGGWTPRTGHLPPGALLVLYTDGLVEVRGEDLAAGLDRLTATLATMPLHDPAAVCDALVAGVGHSGFDDTCVLVCRRLPAR